MLDNLSKEQQLIILGLVFVIVTGLSVMAYRHFVVDDSEEIMINEPKEQMEMVNHVAQKIVVHVTGAVKREGVYKLKAGDRIVDAIETAGGAAVLADLSSLNLAEKAKDGQKIVVPGKPKVVVWVSGNPVIGGSGIVSGKVNINSASEKELCKVQGVGPTTAKKILEYRGSHGPFSKIEDIVKVKSIGKSKFNKIKENICL